MVACFQNRKWLPPDSKHERQFETVTLQEERVTRTRKTLQAGTIDRVVIVIAENGSLVHPTFSVPKVRSLWTTEVETEALGRELTDLCVFRMNRCCQRLGLEDTNM